MKNKLFPRLCISYLSLMQDLPRVSETKAKVMQIFIANSFYCLFCTETYLTACSRTHYFVKHRAGSWRNMVHCNREITVYNIKLWNCWINCYNATCQYQYYHISLSKCNEKHDGTYIKAWSLYKILASITERCWVLKLLQYWHKPLFSRTVIFAFLDFYFF